MVVPASPTSKAKTSSNKSLLRTILQAQPFLLVCLLVVLVGAAYSRFDDYGPTSRSSTSNPCSCNDGIGRSNTEAAGGRETLPSLISSDSSTTTPVDVATAAMKFMPLSCTGVLSGPLVKSDPNMGRIYVRQTLTDPSFKISLHSEEIDGTRWAIMKYGFYYERFITEHAAQIMGNDLTRKTDGIFLDVGMNIGWFSLLAAKLGRDVVAFEPNPLNYHRMCQSVQFNGWIERTDSTASGEDDTDAQSPARIQIFPYGVGATEDVLTLRVNPENPGAGTFHDKEAPSMGNTTSSSRVTNVRIVALDDVAEELKWFEKRTKIALLKCDVEGFDPEVFEGADKLLRSGLVLNIFMEYSKSSGENAERRVAGMVRKIADAGYKVDMVGGWNGAELKNETQMARDAQIRGSNVLADRLWEMIGERVKGGNSGQFNVEWKRI